MQLASCKCKLLGGTALVFWHYLSCIMHLQMQLEISRADSNTKYLCYHNKTIVFVYFWCQHKIQFLQNSLETSLSHGYATSDYPQLSWRLSELDIRSCLRMCKIDETNTQEQTTTMPATSHHPASIHSIHKYAAATKKQRQESSRQLVAPTHNHETYSQNLTPSNHQSAKQRARQ